MDDKTFQFALLGATVFGAVIAGLIGFFLSDWKRKNRILGVWVQSEPDIIDLSDRQILLNPAGSEVKLAKLFERRLLLVNVGNASLSDVRIGVTSTYSKDFDSDSDFVDFRVITEPKGIKVSFDNERVGPRSTYVELLTPFLNERDSIELVYLSSADVEVEVETHLKDVTVIRQAGQRMAVTKREKVIEFLENSKGLEVSGGIIAALLALIAGLMS